MSKITRALQKIFGGSLTPSGNIAQFGSLAAGSPAYSGDPVVIQALSQYLNGWSAAVQGQYSPALEDSNALDYLFSRQLAYLMQAGLAEWDSATIYYIGSWCQVGGVPYVSLTDTNLNLDPTTQTNNWQLLGPQLAPSMKGVAKAWIMFNGSSGAIYDNYNATITRLGTGNYQINFPTGYLQYANYLYSLSCNQDNSTGALVGITRYPGDTKTVNALQIRVADSSNGNAVDVSEICAQIWSS